MQCCCIERTKATNELFFTLKMRSKTRAKQTAGSLCKKGQKHWRSIVKKTTEKTQPSTHVLKKMQFKPACMQREREYPAPQIHWSDTSTCTKWLTEITTIVIEAKLPTSSLVLTSKSRCTFVMYSILTLTYNHTENNTNTTSTIDGPHLCLLRAVSLISLTHKWGASLLHKRSLFLKAVYSSTDDAKQTQCLHCFALWI